MGSLSHFNSKQNDHSFLEQRWKRQITRQVEFFLFTSQSFFLILVPEMGDHSTLS